MIEKMRVRTPDDNQIVQYLSGGNQQKVVIGKWLSLASMAHAADVMKMAVTTSFNNSGLAEILLPEIQKDLDLEVQLLVVGTGQAIKLGEAGDVDAILVAMENKYKNNPINTIDGVKIDFDKEWVHLRKSNTEPIIRIYSESETMATAEHLANKIISDIRELITAKKE